MYVAMELVSELRRGTAGVGPTVGWADEKY
jgi:hypothetical protein